MQESETKFKDLVVVVMTTVGGYILVNHEKYDKDFLEFVKGNIKKAESPREAVRRNIDETFGFKETSISSITSLGYIYDSLTGQKIYVFNVEISHLDNNRVNNHDKFLNYEWIKNDDYDNLARINDTISLAAIQKSKLSKQNLIF